MNNSFKLVGRDIGGFLVRIIKFRLSPLMVLLVAALMAIVTNILVSGVDGLATIVADEVATPIFNAFLALLSTVMNWVIFFSIINGIINIGTIEDLNILGKSVLKKIFVGGFLATLSGVACAFIFFDIKISALSFNLELIKGIRDILLGILPSNIVGAFVNGNMLHILLIGAAIGVAILTIGESVQPLKETIGLLDKVFLKILDFITGFMPIFIYLCIVRILLKNDAQVMLNSLDIFVKYFAPLALFSLLMLLMLYKKCETPVKTVLKEIRLPLSIALGTASSLAALPESFNSLRRLGVPEKLILFGVPLGATLFRPPVFIRYSFVTLALFGVFGVSISQGDLITVIIMSFFFTIATPVVPGGGLVIFALLIKIFNLPMEAFSIVVAINVMADNISSMMNVFFVNALVLTCDKTK